MSAPADKWGGAAAPPPAWIGTGGVVLSSARLAVRVGPEALLRSVGVIVAAQIVHLSQLDQDFQAGTYAIGGVFMQHFESGGTLLDFEPKKMREYFSSKLEEGKEIAASMRASKAS